MNRERECLQAKGNGLETGRECYGVV